MYMDLKQTGELTSFRIPNSDTCISIEQYHNLKKLARYLDELPTGYNGFDMWNYSTFTEYPHVLTHECGSVGCAVGHGPLAGIDAIKGEDWNEYCLRVFGLAVQYDTKVENDPWVWCFDRGWKHVDNTHSGAARRITYMLEKGVPSNAKDMMRVVHHNTGY